MSNYVQQMWDSQANGYGGYGGYGGRREHGKGARIAGWLIGVLAVLSIAAYATQSYWYPYVNSYL